MSKYRLAFAVDKYFEFGGMQRALLRIARECACRGHDVHIFSGSWVGQIPDGLTVHLLDGTALTNHGSRRKFGYELRAAIIGGEFDCVTGSTKVPGLDVYYGGDPCYASRVDETKGQLYKLLPRYRVLRKLEEAVFAAGKNTEILLIAHQERDKFIRYYGTELGRFCLLPPGIDKERLQNDTPTEEVKAAIRRQFGVMPDGYMLLNVGSRFKTKGIDRAIVALAELPKAVKPKTRLVVVGDDNPKPFVKLARTLGIADQVIFAGARQDIALFYYAADLLIHPSYTENTGTTLIEAMVCGLPVLVTENCGFAFHVKKAHAGLVCPSPFEQENLNSMLAEMLTADKRVDWSNNGSAYCEQNDLYSLIERAADIIIARAARNRGSQ